MRKSNSGEVALWVFPVLCLIMALALLYLAYQNAQLKKQLAEVTARPHVNRELRADQLGDKAVPFSALLPDGQEFNVRTDSLSAPLILTWLSYNCDPCVIALERWNLLADEFPGQVWGIAKTSQSEYDAAFSGDNVRFPILTPISDTVFDQYQINMTPQTMVILEDGTIGYVSYGAVAEGAYGKIVDLMLTPYIERR